MDDLNDLTLILKSRFPLVHIDTSEETRAQALLERITNMEQWPLWIWSVTRGLQRPMISESAVYETQEFASALRNIKANPSMGVYVLLDAHAFMQDPVNQRLIKEIALDYNKVARTLVFVGSQFELAPDLQRMSAQFSLSMPNAESIRTIVQQEIQLWQQSNGGSKLRGDAQAANLLVQHLVGMCSDDARRLIRQALRDDNMLTMQDITRILKLKHESLSGGGLLELELDCGSFADVAGQKALKHWLELRRPAFMEPAAGFDIPKGILLLGVQGGGKSLACKAVAGTWGVPLLRLDFASLYNKYHGETERNLRECLKSAEAMAPCVLWIDEIEKGLAPDEGSSDGGVSRRVLGTLLTWMNDRKTRVFLAATANDIASLPPELLRKGRFDEIFFVDLPDADTRQEIFRIHLKRRKLAVEQFDIPALAATADGFSGAEIEQAIVAGLYEAKAKAEPLKTSHIVDELKRTRPLSVVMAEQVQSLRSWAATRTVPAN